MFDIFASLDKVRWHLRLEKISSLHKVLRYRLASKETINYFDVFINMEKILQGLDMNYIMGLELNSDDSATLTAVVASLENLKESVSEIVDSTILLDRLLCFIKCYAFQKCHSHVTTKVEALTLKYVQFHHIHECLDSYSKATWKLILEVYICYSNSLHNRITQLTAYEEKETKKILIEKAMDSISLSVEILYHLIQYQSQQVLAKKVKTGAQVYPRLLSLLFLIFKLYIDRVMQYFPVHEEERNTIALIINSMVFISRSIDLNYVSHNIYAIPFLRMWICLDLMHWFTYKELLLHHSVSQIELKSCDNIFGFPVSLPQTLSSKTWPCYMGSVFLTIYYNVLRVLEYQLSCADISRSEGHKNQRLASKFQIQTMLDLIIILGSQINHHSSISTILLKHLIVGFEDSYHYSQLAFSLSNSGHYVLARKTCERVLEFDPHYKPILSLLLSLLINIFHSYNEAVLLATKFIQLLPNESLFTYSRAVAYLELSLECLSFVESQELLGLAQMDILKTIQLDDNDYESYYHASLITALLDNLDDALLYAAESIQRCLFDSRPYHILFILLVNKRLYSDAMKVLADAIKEFPNDFTLILSKITVEHKVFGVITALNTTKDAIELWNSLYSSCLPPPPSGEMFSALKKTPKSSINYLETSSFSSPSYNPTDHLFSTFTTTGGGEGSTQLSKSGGADSHLLFITPSYIPTPKITLEPAPEKQTCGAIGFQLTAPSNKRDALFLITLLHYKLGELYLELNEYNGLRSCIEDMLLFAQPSPEVFLLQAKLAQVEDSPETCITFLETALYYDPNHVITLHTLALYHLFLFQNKKNDVGSLDITTNPASAHLVTAEETARRMVKVDPKNFKSWQCLGTILAAAENFEESTYCLSRALEMESQSPLISYKSICRSFRPQDIFV